MIWICFVLGYHMKLNLIDNHLKVITSKEEKNKRKNGGKEKEKEKEKEENLSQAKA